MFTSADTAQLLFGFFIIFYGYLLCLDSYNALGKNKNLPKWTEPLFLLILGFIIIFISFSDMMEGCTNHHGEVIASCKDNTATIFLFGLLLCVLGIVELLNQNLEIFSFSTSWVTPAVLVILAILLKSPTPAAHEGAGGHGSHGANFLEQAFTVSVLSAAILRALVRVDAERWGVLSAYAWSLAGLAHAARSQAIFLSLSASFSQHTIFLTICVLACVMLLPLLAYIQWATKDHQPRHLVKDEEVKGF